MKQSHRWGKQNYRKRIQEWASSADDVIQNTSQRTEDGIHTGHAREAMEETWGRSEGAPGRMESHGKELQDSSTSNWVAPEWTTHNSVWILSGTQKIMNQIRSKVLNRVEITLKPRRKVNDKNFQGIPFSSRHPERHEAGKLGIRGTEHSGCGAKL